MKVSYFSPMPPERSGIADYSALLVPALARRVELTVVRRGRTRPVRGTDIALYHVGNNPDAHGWIVEALRRRPGVVVLHDFVLHDLVAAMTLGTGDAQAYVEAMERESGLHGLLLALSVVEGRAPQLWEPRAVDFPLVSDVLADATAVIVHSRYVEDRVRELGFTGRMFRIPHPAWPIPAVDAVELEGSPVIGCFGHLNPSKRIPQLLESFGRIRTRYPRARLLLVGPISQRFDLEGQLAAAGLARSGAVVREEYVDEDRLWSLMAAADVCVSLRSPTMGETSGTCIRALALGKPLVVSDVGWFAELPDGVALGVPVDDGEVEVLTAALELLAADEPVRAALGEAARAYAITELDLERVADRYAAVLELEAGGAAVTDAVLREVAQAAADVGITADSPELAGLAAAARELRLAS
jgi:glycosyltransferase involved in cell wall biosynthesis